MSEPTYEYTVYYRINNWARFHHRNQAIISAGDYWSMHEQSEPVRVYRRLAGSKNPGVLIWRNGRIVGTQTY